MPDCINCPRFSAEKQDCTVGATTRRGDCFLRNCVVAILEKHLPAWNGRVLEIGFGMRKQPRRLLKGRAEWFGVEPRWEEHRERNHFKATAQHLPFPNGFFDHVLATETMEHWHEGDKSTFDGVQEVARVLRSSGTFLATVPFHLHGAKMFQEGDLHAVRSLFGHHWCSIAFEKWRENFEPCPPPFTIVEGMKQNLKPSDFEALKNATRPAYTLEIIAMRS